MKLKIEAILKSLGLSAVALGLLGGCLEVQQNVSSSGAGLDDNGFGRNDSGSKPGIKTEQGSADDGVPFAGVRNQLMLDPRLSLPVAPNTNLITEDFESGDSGLPSLFSYLVPSLTSIQVATDSTEDNRVLRINDQNTRDLAAAVMSFSGEGRLGTVSFRFRDTSSGRWTKFYLMHGRETRIGLNLVEGELTYYKPDGPQVKTGAVTPKEWHTLQISFDNATARYDVSLDGETRVSQGVYLFDPQPVDGLWISTGSHYVHTLDIDDLRIELQ